MVWPSVYGKAWKERHPSHLSYPLNEDCLVTTEKGAGGIKWDTGSWIFISVKWAAVPMGLLTLCIYCMLFVAVFFKQAKSKDFLAQKAVSSWNSWMLKVVEACSFVEVSKQEPFSRKYCPASFPAEGVARSLCCTGGRSKKLKSFLMVQNHCKVTSLLRLPQNQSSDV